MTTVAIHGRFQPFHLGHLDYARRALALGDRFVVGLSDVVVDATLPFAAHRQQSASNPFSYSQRQEMVLAALIEDGVPADRVQVAPFSISTPSAISSHMPPSAIHAISVYDAWGQYKVGLLEGLGLQVEVVAGARWREDVTGTRIRALMSEGRDISECVPSAVWQLLHQWGFTS